MRAGVLAPGRTRALTPHLGEEPHFQTAERKHLDESSLDYVVGVVIMVDGGMTQLGTGWRQPGRRARDRLPRLAPARRPGA